MIPFRQKPNHCFVACLASCLADDGGIKLQELLVRFFPEKLRHGQGVNEGIPPSTKDMEEILVASGVCQKAESITSGHDKLIADLKEGKFALNKLVLMSTSGELHGWRIDTVEKDGLIVMEPMSGNFRKMSWEEFRSSGKALLKMD
jgi:hypothetical protein